MTKRDFLVYCFTMTVAHAQNTFSSSQCVHGCACFHPCASEYIQIFIHGWMSHFWVLHVSPLTLLNHKMRVDSCYGSIILLHKMDILLNVFTVYVIWIHLNKITFPSLIMLLPWPCMWLSWRRNGRKSTISQAGTDIEGLPYVILVTVSISLASVVQFSTHIPFILPCPDTQMLSECFSLSDVVKEVKDQLSVRLPVLLLRGK